MIRIFIYDESYLLDCQKLPTNINSHCETYKNEKQILISKSNYFYLNKILIQNYNCDISNIKFSKYGKPYLDNLQLSLSHTTTYFGFALSDKNIGFDIENAQKTQLKLASYILNQEEQIEYTHSYNKKQYLVRKWCEKEAIGKLIGTGLNKDVLKMSTNNKFLFSLDDDNIFVLVSDQKIEQIELFINNQPATMSALIFCR